MIMSPDQDDWELSRERGHPTARKLLKDPFFWDIADDGAPLGNDTGADTLAHYREWRKKNPGKAVELPLLGILKEWDERTSGEASGDVEELRKVLEADGLEIVDNDDHVIALAFAQLVLEGTVESTLRKQALKAIRRESMEVVISYRGWVSEKERRTRLEKMRQALEAVAQG